MGLRWNVLLLLFLCAALSAHGLASGHVEISNLSVYRARSGVRTDADDLLGPEHLVIQFKANTAMYRIKLKRDASLIEDARDTIKVFMDGAYRSVPASAFPYIGDKIKALGTIQDVGASPPDGVAEEDAFARFVFLMSGGKVVFVQGAFMWRGELINVRWDNERKVPSVSPSALQSHPFHRIRCGHDDLTFNTNLHGAASYFAQQAANRTPRRNAKGCPAKRKMLYLGVVADCSYLQHFKGSSAKAQANIISDFSIVSEIYERAFNISIGLASVILMSECSPSDPASLLAWNGVCAEQPPIDVRLGMFSRWRDTQPSNIGLFHLVSGCSGSEVVGIAWLNQVCQTKSFKANNTTVSGTSVTVLIPNQFATIAHEIAHNFGGVHDCTADQCRNCDSAGNCPCCSCGNTCDCQGRYLMNPQSGGVNVKLFSECTMGDVCGKLSVLAQCLKEPGSMNVVTGGVCGNGIREGNEECDCGSEEACRSDACCTKDCKLKPGAQCRPAGIICRGAQNQCQRDSVCDGLHKDCLDTVNESDGSDCRTEEGHHAKCASGQCTSRDLQCESVGRRLGLNRACATTIDSCRVICQGPTDVCYALDASFIDGTRCGEGGHCYNGQCSESAFTGFVKRNATLISAICSVVALLAIAYLIVLVLDHFRTRRPFPA